MSDPNILKINDQDVDLKDNNLVSTTLTTTVRGEEVTIISVTHKSVADTTGGLKAILMTLEEALIEAVNEKFPA